MVDLDHIAVARLEFGFQHHAARGRQDGRAGRRGEIQPLVHGAAARHRIAAPAVGRAEVGVIGDGHGGRHAGLVGRTPRQGRIQQLQIVGLLGQPGLDVVKLAAQGLGRRRAGRRMVGEQVVHDLGGLGLDQRLRLRQGQLLGQLGIGIGHAGDLGHALAQAVDAHQLGLQGPHLGRQQVHVSAQEIGVAPRLARQRPAHGVYGRQDGSKVSLQRGAADGRRDQGEPQEQRKVPAAQGEMPVLPVAGVHNHDLQGLLPNS